MVNQLSDYPWSSYPSYINQTKAESWLYRDKTYQMLGHRHRYKGYYNYVGKGIDEDIKRFYGKGNILSVLGDKEFRTGRKEENEQVNHDSLRKALEDKPSIGEMIKLVCRITKRTEDSLLRRQNGKPKAKSQPLSRVWHVLLPSI